jgi:membrane protease YdiL (CAAX protease family)
VTRARTNFVLFAVAVVGAGWLGVAADRAAGTELANDAAFSDSGGTPGMLLFILGPVVTALVLYFVSRDGAGGLGLTLRFPHRARWFAAAAALYPVVTAVSVGLGIAAGAVTFTMTGSEPLLAAFLTVLAVQLIKNPIEEFIFRGYGTRTAMALGLPGKVTPHLLVGVVWSAWHLPLYLMWTSDADMRLVTSLSWPGFLALMFAGLTAAAVLYGELRVRTGSIWPGVVLHSMTNAIATPLIVNGHLGFTGHSDALFSPIAGSVVVMVLFGALGLLLVSRRVPRRLDRAEPVQVPLAEADPAVVR